MLGMLVRFPLNGRMVEWTDFMEQLNPVNL